MTTQIRTLDELDGEPHANPFPDAEPKTVRLTLGAGESVPPHAHPGREIVFHLLEGEIELTLGDDTHQLSAGDIARFDGDQQIAPEAVSDSTAVLVLATSTDGED
ncbi:cupin domain-containing protein (plasmid) [Halobacterium sp. NMX12-1]|uniref:Cupin domain-containing protein n=1 Tax=Halobacterium sp. NMX12-1 TaxID=3166650 RepID=A0AAU8C927_9EURY